MLRQIDHIVIISPDLSEAVAVAQEMGFTVVRGGTHADGLTQNALIAFADGSYIELISPTRPDMQGGHRWFARLRHGGGLVDYCLLADDLKEETDAIRERGVDYPEPGPLGRIRPDGVRIDWLLSIPPGNVGATGWPFLIEDITPRSLRVPHEATEITHENGARGIAGVTVLVHNLDAARQSFAAILGTEATDIPSPIDGPARAVRLPIGTAGTQWIAVAEPLSGESRWHTEALGQGPISATLRTHDDVVEATDGVPLVAPIGKGVLLKLA